MFTGNEQRVFGCFDEVRVPLVTVNLSEANKIFGHLTLKKNKKIQSLHNFKNIGKYRV